MRFVSTTSEENNEKTVERGTHLTRILSGGVQLGYSDQRFIAGLRLDVRDTWINENRSSVVENDQLYGLLYFGYRLDPPNFISRTMRKIKEKAKL